MLLHKIRTRILLAQKNLTQINPRINCYVVVSINGSQFMPGDLMPGSSMLMDLFTFPGLFVPKQNVDNLKRLRDRYVQLKVESRTKPANGVLMFELFAEFESAIETVQFGEAQCELRFFSLDLEKIQELKAHPIVKGIGKTNMSRASVNVVVG
jgi:hypothetical protein